MLEKRIEISSEEYPQNLKNITDPPKEIYCIGNLELLNLPCITIVGTRAMTKYGQKVVENFLTEELNDLDVVFVSGLANGIDTQVHSCCLKNGLKTIAVVAGGIDVGYPKSNIELYKQISKEGLVISEYPRGFILEKYMFPRRNRIMVGLSNSVLVIESKAKGGSLITAQLALDYNRDLYAIPGDIDKNSSQGCNILIQAGAFPIASRDDFLRIIGIENGQIKM